MLVPHADQRRKQIAGRLLAHAAVADMRIFAERRGVKADRAALAAARKRAFWHLAFGHWPAPGVHWSVSWSGCWYERRIARMSRSSSVVPWLSVSSSIWPMTGWRLSRASSTV